jgi:hypothetical protein
MPITSGIKIILIRSLVGLAILSFSGCSDENPVEFLADNEVNLSLSGSAYYADTGKINISAELEFAGQDVLFEKIGLLFKESNSTIWDSVLVGSNTNTTQFDYTVHSLKRDQSYDFAAFAKRENFQTKVSDPVTVWTRAFLLDSLRELQSLPNNPISIYGKGFNTLEDEIDVYLVSYYRPDSLKGYFIKSTDDAVVFSYNDPGPIQPGSIQFFDISSVMGVHAAFVYRGNYYKTGDAVNINTKQILITSLMDNPVALGESFYVRGSFGPEENEIKAFLNDVELKRENGFGITSIYGTGHPYHNWTRLDIRIPTDYTPGEYSLKIKYNEYTTEAVEKLIIQ